MTERIARFEIIEKIGEGGMGAVFRARDPKINRIVAIKLLREGFDDEEVRERFMQEARTAGALQHPNIVTIFELGDHHGAPFIVMEFVIGDPLDRLIKRQQPLPVVRKLELIEALCAGLGEAHDAGVVHRDVKPANMIVKTNGVLKILDFGIARVGDSSKTKVGVLVGTPNYMPPEQLNGARVDKRADIFAVGAVLYELLAYRRAFPGNAAEAITRILTRDPEPLSVLCTGLDPQIETVVFRALMKDPDKRFQDLGDMRRRLARIRERLEREAPETIVGTLAVDTIVPPTPRPSSQSSDGESREDAMRRALAEVDAARRLFDSGDVASAVRRLEHFNPPNDLVDEALLNLRNRASEIKRQARREAAIAQAMQTGHDAFDRGDFEGAIGAADDVWLIDEQYTPAHDLRQRARTALDERQRLEELERRARAAIDQARLLFVSEQRQAAVDLLSQFRPVRTDVSAALAELRAEADAIAKRAQEEANRRHADMLVKRGLESLANDKADDALVAANEAVRFVHDHVGARELIANAERLRGELRRRAEHERQARVLVRSCEAQFRAGHRERAVDALRAFAPPHPLVTEAWTRLTGELAEISRKEREDLERALAEQRARAEAERLAKVEAERRAETDRRAREEAEQRARIEAERLAKVEAARRAEAERRTREDAEQRARTEAERLAKAEAARRAEADRRAKEDAEQRARAGAERLAKAEAARRAEAERHAREDAERARAEVERLAKAEATRREEAERQAKAEAERRALEEAARRTKEREDRLREGRIAASLERGARAFESGDFEEAIKHANAALEEAPGSPEAVAMRNRARAGIERRRDADQLRSAEATVRRARGEFEAGRRREAIQLLQQHVPAHALVRDALALLQAELRQLEPPSRKTGLSWRDSSVRVRAGLLAIAAALVLSISIGGYKIYSVYRPVTPVDKGNTGNEPPNTVTTTSVPVPVQAPGTVLVDALPWAEVVRVVDGRGSPQRIVPNSYTPLALTLPSGEYEITVRNGTTRTVKVHIDAAGPNRLDPIDFGHVDAVEYFRRLGWE